MEIAAGMKIKDVERVLVELTVKATPNRKAAAKVLGISLKTLYNKLAYYRLHNEGRIENCAASLPETKWISPASVTPIS